MQEDPEMQDSIELHVRAAGRPDYESILLADRLLQICWPGGVSDRSEPVARGWLRMWGPVKIIATPPACTCAQGRCPVCN
jgi:hypothetical protein